MAFGHLNAIISVKGSNMTIIRSTANQRGVIAISMIAVIIGAGISIVTIDRLIGAIFHVNQLHAWIAIMTFHLI